MAGMRMRWMQTAALGSLTMLAACGGGGGGGVNSTPAPSPSPTVTPTPVPTVTPTPIATPTPTVNYNTAEYRASVGPVSMRALTAYQHGATGAGVTAAIIDSGIDIASSEFTGRISTASQSTSGNPTYDDEGGHGTAVAFTLAGSRNGVGTHGVAFDATLLVLRTDTPGSCAGTAGGSQGECTHSDSAIARAINIATDNNVRVINLSLGGSPPNTTLTAAIRRATEAGIVIVISAGNDGAANPDAFTSPATDSSVGHGLVVIAGSVNGGDQISDFSNRAGSGASAYLAAVGENVRAPCNDTQVCLWSGTSFSAPQISGAVALLAQAFPNLTGNQIVDLLFATARDAGATGIDAIYGHGILDLTEAFEPQGSTSLAGTSAPVSDMANATLSAPMGDAVVGGLGAVILDGYSRAYAMDLARTIQRQGPAYRLAGMLQSRQRTLSGDAGELTVAMTIQPGRDATRIERMFLRAEDAAQARTLAATVMGKLGGGARFAIGAAEGGNVLAARLAGQAQPAFLVAQDPTGQSGFDVATTGSAAVRTQVGAFGLTVAAESGDVLTRRLGDPLRAGQQRFGYDRMTVALDRRIGALQATLGYARLDEQDTVLGARFGGALGAGRAVSSFVDVMGRYDFGAGWSFGGSIRQGWTQARLQGGLTGRGMIRTNAFAADVGKDGVFDASDSFGVRFAQPLRVANGGIDIALPAEWDYATQRVSAFDTQRINLAPTGRELDFEVRYARALGMGRVETNAFLRRHPGNFAYLPDDLGMAVRYAVGF